MKHTDFTEDQQKKIESFIDRGVFDNIDDFLECYNQASNNIPDEWIVSKFADFKSIDDITDNDRVDIYINQAALSNLA